MTNLFSEGELFFLSLFSISLILALVTRIMKIIWY